MLAHSRAASAVEVSDLLAGMYIYDWERLSKYWPEQDGIEEYLQQICRISPQRWHYWIEFYDQQRRGDEKPPKWQWPRPAKSPDADSKPLARSSELTALLKIAEEIAPAHDVLEGRQHSDPHLRMCATGHCQAHGFGNRASARGFWIERELNWNRLHATRVTRRYINLPTAAFQREHGRVSTQIINLKCGHIAARGARGSRQT